MAALEIVRTYTTTAVVPGTGSIPGAPATTEGGYYFLATSGVYAGDLATAVGIQNQATAGEDEDWSGEPLTSIKELLRCGIIDETNVIVADSSGNEYTYKMYVNSDIGANDEALITKLKAGVKWTGKGKGNGGTTQRIVHRRHVVSRT